MTNTQDPTTEQASTEIHPLLAARWSTRAFDKNHEISDAQLTAIIEAARWAPSAMNAQPWRFIVGRRGGFAFSQIFEALAPGNQIWAGNASALLVIVAEVKDLAGNVSKSALYDTGLAAGQLTFQAHAEGLHVHQMGGFDRDRIKAQFALADGYEPIVVIAVGAHDAELELPEPFSTRESAPRVRMPISDLLLGVNDAN